MQTEMFIDIWFVLPLSGPSQYKNWTQIGNLTIWKPLQERNQSGRDELELTNVDGLYGGLSPHQRLDLLNRKIKPDGRLV